MSGQNSTRKWRLGRWVGVAALSMFATAQSHASAIARPDRVPVQAIAAAARALSPPAAASPAGEVLGGLTSQDWPVVLEVSGSGEHFSLIRTGLTMRCTAGDSFALRAGGPNLPIGSDGRTHATAQIPPQIPSDPGSAASLIGGTETFGGRLSRKQSTFAGIWQLHFPTRKRPDGSVRFGPDQVDRPALKASLATSCKVTRRLICPPGHPPR
jgi:hypothetical protein